MSVIVPHGAVASISKAEDPKQAILDKLGSSLDGVEVLSNMVLVGTYIRPEKTKGGVYRPDMNIQEDVWQGKVGLVLKLGRNAYVDGDGYSFFGERVEVGEWCVYKVGDAWSLNINGLPCRLVRDSNIRLKV